MMQLGHAVDRIKKNEMGEAFETFRDRRGAYRILVGEMMEGDHLEDLGVDGWIILRWICRKWVGGHGLD